MNRPRIIRTRCHQGSFKRVEFRALVMDTADRRDAVLLDSDEAWQEPLFENNPSGRVPNLNPWSSSHYLTRWHNNPQNEQ